MSCDKNIYETLNNKRSRSRYQVYELIPFGLKVPANQLTISLLNVSYPKPHRTPGGGILLYGPPNCGENYLVDAILERSLDTKKLQLDWDHMSNGQIKNFFQKALELAKSAVIIIPRFDALVKQPSILSTVTQEIYRTIDSGRNILVLGFGNNPWKYPSGVLGLFGKKINIPAPKLEWKVALLDHYIKEVVAKQELDVYNLQILPSDLETIIEKTPQLQNVSWTDLENLAKDAFDSALRAKLGLASDQPIPKLSLSHATEVKQDLFFRKEHVRCEAMRMHIAPGGKLTLAENEAEEAFKLKFGVNGYSSIKEKDEKENKEMEENSRKRIENMGLWYWFCEFFITFIENWF